MKHNENEDDNNDGKDSEDFTGTIATKETRAICVLRASVLVLLLVSATFVSVVVYLHTSNDDKHRFEDVFESRAQRIITLFHAKQTFPFVTVPHFVLRGCDLRIQANAMIVRWFPLVTDEQRSEWEYYAFQNREQADAGYEEEKRRSEIQDAEFGISYSASSNEDDRLLQQSSSGTEPTVLDDGTGYHKHIWSAGGGDARNGTGPYLPFWQRSPVGTNKQELLNVDFTTTRIFTGVLPVIQRTGEAVMSRATIPGEGAKAALRITLEAGQYRHSIDEYIDDPVTAFAYPVFDSFENDSRQLVGVLSTNVYWKLLFAGILPPASKGFVCVLENSFNQTLSYLIDGVDVTYPGEGDFHDTRYDYLEQNADVNSYVRGRAGPETRSYTSVPLNDDFGKYKLRIYPSKKTEEGFRTKKPLLYTAVVAAAFIFTSASFAIFAVIVERRQKIVMERVVRNAREAAAAERRLNEFVAHEVRNTLAAALSAHEFVVAAIRDGIVHDGDDATKSMHDDLKTIGSSLRFIDELLRNMLDTYRACAKKLSVDLTPTDLLKDVLEPVCGILQQREGDVAVSMD